MKLNFFLKSSRDTEAWHFRKLNYQMHMQHLLFEKHHKFCKKNKRKKLQMPWNWTMSIKLNQTQTKLGRKQECQIDASQYHATKALELDLTVEGRVRKLFYSIKLPYNYNQHPESYIALIFFFKMKSNSNAVTYLRSILFLYKTILSPVHFLLSIKMR